MKTFDFVFCLITSISFIHNVRSDVVASTEYFNLADYEFEHLRNSTELLKEKAAWLRNKVEELKAETNKLSNKMRALRQYTNDVDTYYRNDDLEILGVSRVENESLIEIVRNISEALGLGFNEREINAVWRKHEVGGPSGRKSESDSIVVKFVSRTTRQKWLNSARQKTVLYSRDCLPALPETEVFINEHLSHAKQVLIKTAKALESQGRIPYAWLKDGHVYIRKTPMGKAIRIRDQRNFHSLGLMSNKTIS